MPRRRIIFLLGGLLALGAASPVARAQAPFDSPPLPDIPAAGPSAVRGVQSLNQPPSGPAVPSGVAGAPAATFVAPGGADGQLPEATGTAPPIVPTDAQPITGSEIVARVEDQVVLASDVMWQVNQLIAMNGADIPPERVPEVQRMLLERMVMQLIDTKLLFADFRRTVPPENLPKVEETIAEPFEKIEVPRLLKMYKVNDRPQLEAALKANGSSMRDVQRQYTEKTIAGEWIRQRLPKPKPIAYEEMLAYYQDHPKEFEFPAKATWEELMVRFDRTGGDRDAAWKLLAEMGNEVWGKVTANPNLRGPVFAETAKAKSHGFTAAEGGIQHTSPGSLKCEDLNTALATLQLGRMSDCIESEMGFHIIRVLERTDAGRTPFTEAQVKIRELLEGEQKEALVKAEIEKVRKSARVWTIFQGDLNGERLAEVLDGKQKR